MQLCPPGGGRARQGAREYVTRKTYFAKHGQPLSAPAPPSLLVLLYTTAPSVTSHGRRPGTAARGWRTRRTARGRGGRRPPTPMGTHRSGRDGPPRATPSGGRDAHPPPAMGRAAQARGPRRRPAAVRRPGMAPVRRLAGKDPPTPTPPPPPLSLEQFTQQWTSPPPSGRPWRSASRPTPTGRP